MKRLTVVAALVSVVFLGHDSLVAVAQTGKQNNEQKSVEPCEVELPEFMQRIRFQENQERKEMDEGLRRQFRFKATSEDVVSLQDVKSSLKFLEVLGRKLSEAELRMLSELPNLEKLNLSECDIDDHDLLILRPCLQNLKVLWLTNNPISDASMQLIAELSSLESLGLSKTQLTDSGAARLPELKNLRTISLAETKVTDLVSASLAKCTDLISIQIGHNKSLTNKSIAALVPLASLSMLQIDNTSVNEDCLEDLIRMPNLTFFHTGGLNFRPEAERRLKAEALKKNKNADFTKPYNGPRFTIYKLDCIDGWSFKKLKEKQTAWEAVMGITGGVELPTDAYNIHAAQGSFSPDQKNYLVFSTTLEGITAFAEKMNGKKLAEFCALEDGDFGRMSGEKAHIARGFPWKADSATESLFSTMPASNGGIVIDMKNLTIYLKR